MSIVSYIFVALLGAIMGSFLNVVLFRFGSGKNFGGRSLCQSCGKVLSWIELVPILSYFIQKRKCRGCSSLISLQYPLVELGTAVVFALTFWRLSTSLEFYSIWASLSAGLTVLAYMTGMSFLVLIAVYDLRHKLIPDQWVLGLAVIGITLPLVMNIGFGSIVFASINKGLAAVILGLFFWAIWHYSDGRAMGFGDVKLSMALGLFLGLDQGIVALVLAFWIGAVVGLGLIAATRLKLPVALPSIQTMKSEIPFAPFLVLGAIIAFVFDLRILDWILI